MTADGALAGRRAIVTGATRGIGAATARALDALGAHVLLVARHADALALVARELHHAVTITADLTLSGAGALVAAEAPALLGGPVDILVNNAGVFAVAPIDETTDATLDAMLALNIAAPFRLLRALLPAMRARASGHIVTIGSIADRKALRGNATYAATKFGARALHEVARDELHGTGVRVTLISPAATDTPLWDAIDPDNREGFTPRAAMLKPGQVADAVTWALTRDAGVNIDELRLSHS